MEPSIVTSVVLFIASLILGVNGFLLSNLIKKIEAASNQTIINSTQIDGVMKQLADNGKDFSEMSRYMGNVDKELALLRQNVAHYIETYGLYTNGKPKPTKRG